MLLADAGARSMVFGGPFRVVVMVGLLRSVRDGRCQPSGSRVIVRGEGVGTGTCDFIPGGISWIPDGTTRDQTE